MQNLHLKMRYLPIRDLRMPARPDFALGLRSSGDTLLQNVVSSI
jgi:hypothetical protein